MAFSDWQPGMRITAERLRGSTPQAPQAWTPVWTTSTGTATPDFGNATVVGEYQVFGRLCIGSLDIAFGSTTDFGTSPTTSDNWRFSTPVSAAGTNDNVGTAELDGTGGERLLARARLTTVDTFELEISSGRVDATAVANSGIVDSLSPWTWSAADNLRMHFQFPTAA